MWQTYYGLTPDELNGREPEPAWKRLKMIGQMHAARAKADAEFDRKGHRIARKRK